MFDELKRIFFLLMFVSSVGGCSTATTTLQLPLSGSSFQLPIESRDKLLIGGFVLLKSKNSYLSLQVMNAIEENREYGLSAIQLIEQLYGFGQPSHKDIDLTKKAFSDEIIEKKELGHEHFFAIYLKETGDRERIMFAPKNADSLVYYILETQGKDAIKFFNGVK